jgi:hypothetical protein
VARTLGVASVATAAPGGAVVVAVVVVIVVDVVVVEAGRWGGSRTRTARRVG